MDTLSEKKLQAITLTADKISANDLSHLLDKYGQKIKFLSFDCFDTLIWRKTRAPRDVFYDLQNKPHFKSLGISAVVRMNSEIMARQLSKIKKNTSEVTLNEIYLQGFPHLSNEKINYLINEELQAEKEACYAFYPMVDLLHAAVQRGIKIIIVSDIYFSEDQLRDLLSSVLSKETLEKIHKIFVSCDRGVSKCNGLFNNVLQTLGCDPDHILHMGDNLEADYISPKTHKINALHFIQHDEPIAGLFRLSDTATKILDPSIRYRYPFYMPFGGLFGLNTSSFQHAEKTLGYASLGQLMYAFANFIGKEVADLQALNKKTKVIFLMRDAYLPSRACEVLWEKELGKRVRISRFASYAASFLSLEDIDHYLIEVGSTNRILDVARQLLLPEKVMQSLLKIAEKSPYPVEEFFKLIRRKDIVRIILNKSAEYRARLIKHLQKEVGIESGDTLVFVDLGYSGTAQRRLTPVFKSLGIEVIGRYLLSLSVPGWEHNRRGLMDPSWCDDKALLTLVFYITLLEQLCTSNEKSVVDYDKEGNAIYSDVMMNIEQQQKLQHIQMEALQFVKDAKDFQQKTNTSFSDEMLRQMAMTELGRMIFLPTEAELNYLQSFQAEMNLGTNDILRVFDPLQGLTGLRRRGMFYMEKPSKTTRTNYPAELRTAGIELVLSLMVQHRFELDLKLQDMVVRREQLPILFRQGNEAHQTAVDAIPTHDGFFAVWLPAHLEVHILLGEVYEWIQIESVELIKMDAFINQTESQNTQDVSNWISLYEIYQRGDDLFECLTRQGKLVIHPDQPLNANEYVLRLIYRPLVKQQSDTSLYKTEGNSLSIVS